MRCCGLLNYCEPANWWRTLRIDKGLRDGVNTNCAVFTTEGLVGRISDAGFAQAQVVLVGDPNCRVAKAIDTARFLRMFLDRLCPPPRRRASS